MSDLNTLQQRIQDRTEYLELVMGLDHTIIEDLMVDATANVEAIVDTLNEIDINCKSFVYEFQEMTDDVKALRGGREVITKIKSFGQMLKDHLEYAGRIKLKLHAVVAVQRNIYFNTLA